MTRKDLIDTIRRRLADDSGPELSAAATAKVVDAVFAAVAEGLRREGRYVHPTFGSFTVHVTQARPGRNPRTGAAIELPRSETVRFKPARELKESLELGEG
jgi:nucleoid DNA-binding protein